MEREEGFYWVRWEDNNAWDIARWNGLGWLRTGDIYIYEDINFGEIGERIERKGD